MHITYAHYLIRHQPLYLPLNLKIISTQIYLADHQSPHDCRDLLESHTRLTWHLPLRQVSDAVRHPEKHAMDGTT